MPQRGRTSCGRCWRKWRKTHERTNYRLQVRRREICGGVMA
nr:MAG TPA: Cerato-platanin-like protein [Caudoviricetes sp.]